MKVRTIASRDGKSNSSSPKSLAHKGKAKATEEAPEPNAPVIDYRVLQPAPPIPPAVRDPHEWADQREAERFQEEFERRKAMGQAYKYLQPIK